MPLLDKFNIGPTVRIVEYIGDEEEIHTEGRIYTAQHIDVTVVENSAQVKMSSLLPAGWRIVETDALDGGNEGECTPGDEGAEVHIPRSVYSEEQDDQVPYLSTVGAMLTVLHEIGHVRREAAKTLQEFAEFQEARTLSAGASSPLSVEQQRLLGRAILENELGAWHFCLDELARLRELGIDLLPGMDEQVLRQEVSRSMLTYRERLARLGVAEDVLDLYRSIGCSNRKIPGYRAHSNPVQDAEPIQ